MEYALHIDLQLHTQLQLRVSSKSLQLFQVRGDEPSAMHVTHPLTWTEHFIKDIHSPPFETGFPGVFLTTQKTNKQVRAIVQPLF
jgi:hypothetical protein